MVDIQRLRNKIPPSFSVSGEKNGVVVARRGWEEELRKLGGKDRRNPGKDCPGLKYLRGRGRPVILPVARGGMVVRHYYHGGLFGSLTRDLFRGISRPLRELHLLVEAENEGISVPSAVGLVIRQGPVGLVKADLVTLYISGSVDLLSYYRSRAHQPGRQRRAIIAETARQVKRMHRCGIFHSDLQLKNILLRESSSGWRVFILDFDRAVRAAPLSRRAVLKNLLRFYRSFKKMQQVKNGISNRDPFRFLLAYSPDDKDFRKAAARQANRYRRIIRLHCWKWRLAGKIRGDLYARPRGRQERGAGEQTEFR